MLDVVLPPIGGFFMTKFRRGIKMTLEERVTALEKKAYVDLQEAANTQAAEFSDVGVQKNLSALIKNILRLNDVTRKSL